MTQTSRAGKDSRRSPQLTEVYRRLGFDTMTPREIEVVRVIADATSPPTLDQIATRAGCTSSEALGVLLKLYDADAIERVYGAFKRKYRLTSDLANIKPIERKPKP